MSKRATGRFDVKVQPGPSPLDGLGQMSVAKTFQGDLEGTGTGEMLAPRTGTDGSAGYVLLERISATLGGRTGSFVLQHFGLMERGVAEARITVVPDSGMGELVGIRGDMTIDPARDHSYVFDYTIPEAA